MYTKNNWYDILCLDILNKKERNGRKMKNKQIVGAPSYGNTRKTDTTVLESHGNKAGITLVALVITILFSYDEKLKCSNSKGFLLVTI